MHFCRWIPLQEKIRSLRTNSATYEISGDNLKGILNWIRRYPHIKYLGYLPVYLAIYFLAEHLVTTHYWVSHMPIDDAIPFVPAMVLFYDLWYPAMIVIGVYLLLRDPENFVRYMKYLFYTLFLCEAVWLLFPNGQDLRPAITGQENIFTWIVSAIYAADTNTNVLPSAHVTGAVAVAVAVLHCPSLQSKRWLQVGTVVLCTLIAISTVFIKQHSMLDVLAGVVASVPFYLVFYWKRVRKEEALFNEN